MDTVKIHLIWMLFLSDIFQSTVPTVNVVFACGQIEIVRPAIAGRNVTLKFVPDSVQQNATVNWKRRGGNNPWSSLTHAPGFVNYKKNGVYHLTIIGASEGDDVDYKVKYKNGDRNICTSDVVTVTLINLIGCGYLYLRSSQTILYETLEIGYYPKMDVFNNPGRYVRYWLRNGECKKGRNTDQPDSKFEEILLPNNEYVLKIHNLSSSDGGLYKLQCTSGRDTNVFTEQVNITLPVAPSMPTLSPLDTVDDCTGCIMGKDDTKIEVVCTSRGGTKPINVTMEVTDTRLPVESDGSGDYRASLRLNDSLHHMAKMVCLVDNYAIAIPFKAEAYIYVIKPPTTPSLYIPSSLIEGDPVNINCTTTNTRPAPDNITLLVDGNLVEGLELRHKEDDVTLLYNSWLTLTEFKRSWNRKNMTCCVYNHGEQNMCSFPQSVDLIFPPDSVALEVVTNITQEKQHYVLKVICHINGSNPACNATWQAPDEVLLLNGKDGPDERSKDGANNSLYSAFVNVSAADNGQNITCTPTCGSHFDVLPSSSWSILIPYVPTIEFTTSSSQLQVLKGSTAYVTCTGQSQPPSRIVWFRSDVNNSVIPCIENDILHTTVSSVNSLPGSHQGSINECTIEIDTRIIGDKTIHLFCRADHIFRSVNRSFTINIIDQQSKGNIALPIELIGGIGGVVALVIIGTCLVVIGACKHKKAKEDVNLTPNDEELIEYDRRHDSPSSNEQEQNDDIELVYLDLAFDNKTEPSNQPVRKRCESPVDYVGIDYVKTVLSAKENDCEAEENSIYINQ